MLLFIQSSICTQYRRVGFKYISCYCLSRPSRTSNRRRIIQIHLMLLFIQQLALVSWLLSGFKYISCYCLSKENVLVPNPVNHSNTSHVIVYRTHRTPQRAACDIQIHLMLLFILPRFGIAGKKLNSNTSHVIVYLRRIKLKGGIPDNSNTSHVIVYRTGTCCC